MDRRVCVPSKLRMACSHNKTCCKENERTNTESLNVRKPTQNRNQTRLKCRDLNTTLYTQNDSHGQKSVWLNELGTARPQSQDSRSVSALSPNKNKQDRSYRTLRGSLKYLIFSVLMFLMHLNISEYNLSHLSDMAGLYYENNCCLISKGNIFIISASLLFTKATSLLHSLPIKTITLPLLALCASELSYRNVFHSQVEAYVNLILE